MVVLTVCLLGLRLRWLMFLTLVSLMLPSLHFAYAAKAGRLFRWVFLVGLLAKGMTSRVGTRLRPRPVTSVHVSILLLALLVFASILWSIGPALTVSKGGMMCVLWAGVFLVLWNSWRTGEAILAVCNALFWLACLLYFLELAYMIAGIGELAQGRYAGAFNNPNGLGTSVAFLGPFVFWKHIASPRIGVRRLTTFLGLVMVVSLLASGSRSGLLGALVCMGVVTTYIYRAKVAVLVATVGLPLGLLLVLSPRLDATVFDDTRIVRAESLAHFSDRLPMWEEGFGYFLRRPIQGYGFGMNGFVEFGRANASLEQSLIRSRGTNYHNTHLQIALDLGGIGLLLFWYFLYAVIRRGVAIYRDPARSEISMAGIAFFAAFLALVGDSFVHGWAFSPGSSSGIVFWLVAACLVRVHLLSRERAATVEDKKPEAAVVQS